jgi:hypothetical protein
MVRRRWLAWVVATVLAVAGSQVAHWLAYAVVGQTAAERAHLLADSGHGYLTYLPLALGLLTSLLVLALVSEVRHAAAGSTARPPGFWPFAALAPMLFACQEHLERLAHDGTFPWGAFAEPTFAVGLLLQLPFALAAYLVARALIGVARSLGRRLRHVLTPAPPEPSPSWSAVHLVLRRPSLCSLGYGTRGPPPVAV